MWVITTANTRMPADCSTGGLPDRDPPDKDPPWTETPLPGQRPPCLDRGPPRQKPPLDRNPPGQRAPQDRDRDPLTPVDRRTPVKT